MLLNNIQGFVQGELTNNQITIVYCQVKVLVLLSARAMCSFLCGCISETPSQVSAWNHNVSQIWMDAPMFVLLNPLSVVLPQSGDVRRTFHHILPLNSSSPIFLSLTGYLRPSLWRAIPFKSEWGSFSKACWTLMMAAIEVQYRPVPSGIMIDFTIIYSICSMVNVQST